MKLLRKLLRQGSSADGEQQLLGLRRKVSRLEAMVDVFAEEKEYEKNSDVGMNGQKIRKRIIEDICKQYEPDIVIETGTFFGLTSGYLATRLEVPVYTSEIDKRHFCVAKYLLRNIEGIHQYQMDSRDFLQLLAKDEQISHQRPLVYLDAHWQDDLPLREELIIVFDTFESACVVVDDFQVPWDDSYLWDDYGHGLALTPDYIRDILIERDLRLLLPSDPAKSETGGKRGCAIIVRSDDLEAIECIKGLRLLGL